ncbi:MAG: Ig-like domain-containing protein [Bacteroidales bacterium]
MRLFTIRHTLYPIPLLLFAAALPALADGTININNPSAGTGWTVSGNVVTITANGNYTVTGSSTTNRIVINKDVTATVTLQNANIHSAVASPFSLSSDTIAGGKGSQVTLILEGTNELVTTEVFSAGLTVEDSAKLTIDGTGSLLAQGAGNIYNSGGAGIGGGYDKAAGTVIIQSGTVTATGGFASAGIGGGAYRTGGSITVAGGTITATAGMYAAGIGGGYDADGGNITVTGGTITAHGGEYHAAGIGGSYSGNGGKITVTGGTITAISGQYAAGIGGGSSGSGGNIVIRGGVIVAVSSGGTGEPAGIGGGSLSADAGTVTITGGTVYASGGIGPGIGGGAHAIGGVINITGGTVIADEIGIGNGSTTATNISGANTLVLSQSINTSTFGGATVLTGYNVGVSGYITVGDTIADVTLHADLTIPSGCTLTVPAGIVFDVNHRRLTVNGALVRQGQVINEDYIPPVRDINLTSIGRVDGDGWIFRDNVVTITASGDRTITGSSDSVRVVIDKDVTAVITLDNVRIHSAVASPFSLSSDTVSGSDVTLILVGSNELVTTVVGSSGLRGTAGLLVEDSARLTIKGAGSLVAISPGGPGDPAGIGGGYEGDAGIINITGGTIYACGGSGPGIGGGAVATGGVINITGGTVIADDIGIGNGTTETHISGANTLVLSPSINTTSFGGAQVLTGTNIGISCSVLEGNIDYKVTLHGDLTVPAGCTLTVPAGIVFDVNHKRLTVNGELVRLGQVINEDYIPPVRDINLSALDNTDIDRDGWTYLGNIVTITGSGDRTITGSSDVVSIVIEKDVTAVITLNNVRIHSAGASPISLSSDAAGGSQVTVKLVGSNELVTTGARAAGLRVENNAGLTIEGTGSLVAMTPGGEGDPAGIGGGGFADAGTINITGGTVYASGGTGPGIGGGAGATGGEINITGGIVIADEIGMGNTRTETYISGANTIALSPSINTTSFGGAQVLTGTNIGISCTVLDGNIDYKVTLNGDLIIPSGSILIVPAGIVFDVNHKILVNNGIIRAYGSIINTGYLTGNPPAGVVRIGEIPAQVYTGDSIKPLVTVTDGDVTLTHGVHYSVAYTNNVNAGTATVTVTDLGNSYSVTRNFTINPETLASGAIRIEDIPAQEWTGSAIQPAITVKHGDSTLVQGRDYTVEYADNKDAGIATVRISGTGNYTGSRALNFVIQRTPVTGWMPKDIPAQTYTGEPLTPPVVVTAGSDTLTPGTDYTVEYSDNVNVGTGTAKVRGKGIYTGEATLRFTINPRPVAGAWLGTISDRTYTGDSIKPAVAVWDGNRRLLPGTDYALEYSNNINAGTATITITGRGNYGGRADRDFAIIPKRIAAEWLDDIPGQAHTGKALTPAVVVKDSSKVLLAGRDYTVEYSNNVNAGTATATVTGTGNYAGKASATFAIVPQEKADSSWWVEALPARTYTGNPIEPLVVVKDNNGTLARGNDYSIKYANNVNAGTATVTVTGRGNYTGAASLTFAILPQSILGEWLMPLPVQAWTGDSVKPAVTVKDGTRTLIAGRDYTVEYNNNVSTGTAGATVTGVGNFTGTAYIAFEIRVAVTTLTDSLVQGIPAATYTGYPIAPEVTVPGLSESRDYTVWYAAPATNVGTYEVKITGRGNCTGTVVKSFVIQSKPITSVMIAGANEHPYTGEAVEPVTVIDHDRNALLQKETDYGITYSNNTAEGVASFTVTGRGNYGGTVSGTFRIVSGSRTVIRSEWIPAIADREYTGAAIEPAVTVTGLVRGIDYTSGYAGNVNAGTATVTITGMGNYTGTVNKTFTINPKPIAADWIAHLPAQVYTGDSIKPAIAVGDGGRTLSLHTDYTVAWSNNVNAGTATVTVTGVGNYTGMAGASFAIGGKLLSGATISVQEEGYYTGLPSEPAVTVVEGSRTLIAGTDYAAEYSNNVNAGTATVTVTGRGNYTGTASRAFTVHPKPVAGNWLDSIPAQTYTGSRIEPAVTVRDGARTLAAGTDYTVNYSNNVNAGTATVTLTGMGNYTGTATGTFRIVGVPAAVTYSIRVGLAVSDEARRHIELSFPPSAEYGAVVSLFVHIAEGVEMEGLTVYANGREIPAAGFDAASHSYRVLLKVEGDMEVTVSGLHLTGTEEAAGAALRITPAGGGLLVSGLTPGETLSIYTLPGQLIYQASAASPEETIYLGEKGVYILYHAGQYSKFAY